MSREDFELNVQQTYYQEGSTVQNLIDNNLLVDGNHLTQAEMVVDGVNQLVILTGVPVENGKAPKYTAKPVGHTG
jgi:hypothetical protein